MAITLVDFLVNVDQDYNIQETQPWPKIGQEFDLWVAAIPEDDIPLLIIVDPPNEVSVVLSTASGRYMTDELFGNDLPKTPGLWALRVKFFVDYYTDWESGNSEDEYGFEILKMDKI